MTSVSLALVPLTNVPIDILIYYEGSAFYSGKVALPLK